MKAPHMTPTEDPGLVSSRGEGGEELGSARHQNDARDAKTQRDAERKCRTPGVRYSTSMASPNTLMVRVRFPFGIEDWATGRSAVTEGPKLQRYDQMYAERKRVDDLIHDQMEAVAVDCFRVVEALTPGFRLAAAEWNEEAGGRPYCMTDWVELTFGEQRDYAAREASEPQPRDQQVAGDRSRETPLLNTSEADEKR